MPFDASLAAATRRNASPSPRRVAAWLFGMCAMLLVMIALGGATRLTGSGLSIMEWAPLMGAVPPLSGAEWRRLYGLYQQIPQYQLVNHGFGLEGFKHIFWLEWAHRLWGRLIGVAFFAPLVWFAVRGSIGVRLGRRLGLLFLLGGLQGAVGWFMVASGFAAGSTAVSAYRLVVHLVLALLLYAAILWTALSLWREGMPASVVPGLRRLTGSVCIVVALTIVAGGFVAGLHAGLAYNTFPWMDGRLAPESYAQLRPFWLNLTENVAAVQFDHRLAATAAALLTTATVVLGLLRGASGGLRLALAALGAAVLAQYGLGVATLLWVVPPALGTAHQAMAAGVLTAALVALHLQTARPPRSGTTCPPRSGMRCPPRSGSH